MNNSLYGAFVKEALLKKLAGVEINLYGYSKDTPQNSEDAYDLRRSARVKSPFFSKTSGRLTALILRNSSAAQLFTSDFSYGATKDRKLSKAKLKEFLKRYKSLSEGAPSVRGSDQKYHKAFTQHAAYLLRSPKAKFYRLEWE